MIVDGKISVPRVLINLGRPMAVILLVTTIVTVLHWRFAQKWDGVSSTPFTVIGIALSVFLNFRNNTVYSRWWEGRTLWGALINHSRTFARQAATYLAASPVEEETGELRALRRELVLRHIGFVHAFRLHLRDDDPCVGLEGYVPHEEVEHYRSHARNIPSAVLHTQGERLRYAWSRGWLRDFHLPAVDQTVTEFTNILGGCERIKNTPLPPVYTYLGHKVVVAYCCLLPFGLVNDLGLGTPVAVLAISVAFLILDRISFLIETPFGMRVNDLPLGAMSRTIEIDLKQRLGDEAPEPAKPQQGVLL